MRPRAHSAPSKQAQSSLLRRMIFSLRVSGYTPDGRATVFKKSLLVSGLTCFVAVNAWGLDEAGTRYVKMLANGGPSSMRSAAESIFNTGNTDQEVLDAAAEALLTNY